MEVEHLKVKEEDETRKQTTICCRSTPDNPADIYTRKNKFTIKLHAMPSTKHSNLIHAVYQQPTRYYKGNVPFKRIRGAFAVTCKMREKIKRLCHLFHYR